MHKQKRQHYHAKTTVHWRSTHGAGHILYSVSLDDALTTAAVRPFFDWLRCCPIILPQQRLKTIIPFPQNVFGRSLFNRVMLVFFTCPKNRILEIPIKIMYKIGSFQKWLEAQEANWSHSLILKVTFFWHIPYMMKAAYYWIKVCQR